MPIQVPTSPEHDDLTARVAALEAATPVDHAAEIAALQATVADLRVVVLEGGAAPSTTMTVQEINAATASLEDAGGGTLQLGPGIILVSEPVLMRRSVAIVGAKLATVFDGTGYDGDVFAAGTFQGNHVRRVALKHFMVKGGAIGLNMRHIAECHLDDLWVEGAAQYGIYWQDSIVSLVTNCKSRDSGVNVFVGDTTTTLTWLGGRMQNADRENMVIQKGSASIYVGGTATMESAGNANSAPAVRIGPGVKRVWLDHVHIEASRNPGGASILVEPNDPNEQDTFTVIESCSIAAAGIGNADYAVDYQGGRDHVFRDNYTAGHNVATVRLAPGVPRVKLYRGRSSDAAWRTGSGVPVFEVNP